MKKIIIGLLVLVSIGFCAVGRHSDRDWTITQLRVSANATRVTNPQSGMLFLEGHGADCYIAFNATADVTSIKIPDCGSIDLYPASIKFGEYFTVYSASVMTVNYMILD